MKPIDREYLLLQFKVNIYKKKGFEFQSFFEDIMERVFPNFKKIPSWGGDGGNDGWIKELGRYYQVYAPNTPETKDAAAAKKLKENFKTLKEQWNSTSEIKEYYFVFNDEYNGSHKAEKVIAELERENPEIKFKLFLAIDLERIFFKLDESDILSLGFNIDQRRSISIVSDYLENVKIRLKRGNVKIANSILENSKKIISDLNNESLSLEYELLECRCLQGLERVNDAKDKYNSIINRFPKDPLAFLYLAEVYLNDKNFDKNKDLLEKAEKIDNNFWLLDLEKIVRKIHLGEKIDLKEINEKTFPTNKEERADFYRLYSIFYENAKYPKEADTFIERAIFLNSDKFISHIAKLSIVANRLPSIEDASEKLQKSDELLKEISEVENKFLEYGEIRARNNAILNSLKLEAFLIRENFPEYVKVSKETFDLCLTCYFDAQIEVVLTEMLHRVSLPDNDLNKLLEYLKKSKNKISDELSNALIFQFNLKNNLLTTGEEFFKETHNQKYLEIITVLKNKDNKKFLELLKSNTHLTKIFASTLKSFPDLRRNIIENLPDDKEIKKDKLLMLLNLDEKDFKEAFKILKKLDLSDLSYLECKPALQIAHEKKAWDSEIIILQKLLVRERNEKERINLQLLLFEAYYNFKKYKEVIDIGEHLLEKDSTEKFLDKTNKEILLNNTIIACIERGKVDKEYFKKSKEILERYHLGEPSFEFKVGAGAEVYLKNNEVDKALESVIEGVEIKKVLSPQEYAKLYFRIFLQIGNKIDLDQKSIGTVKENTFVKIKNKDQWYFIGENNNLDAIQISKDKYRLFINKKLGEKVTIKRKYGSSSLEGVIEIILPIDGYILWQVKHNFQKLANEEDLEGVMMIEVPPKGDSIDPKYLLKALEDLHKRTEPFFKIYCKNNIPLAMLAVSEGGLLNAVGRILQENEGYINFSTGTEEFKKQKEIAKEVINKKVPFYIDSTSVFFLSEQGLLKRICTYIPNLRIPQSVLNLLTDVLERFEYIPGQKSNLGYSKGRIVFSLIDKDEKDSIRANIIESIKLLESNPKNIDFISSANKTDCSSEQKIPAELCDACILAQKNNTPLMTEDFLYLKLNELETKKEVPEYFSSLALLEVLYEKKQISFNEYLDYFIHLSSCRFRFLLLNPDFIEKAVFGDGKIRIVNPENIRKLNFPLTLSEEYGVLFQTAFRIIVIFLLKVLKNSTIPPDIAEKVFVEVLESFPLEMDKKEFGQILLKVCCGVLDKIKSSLILDDLAKAMNEKINRFSKALEIYNSEEKLWIPKNRIKYSSF